jgi:hypothetical protein
MVAFCTLTMMAALFWYRSADGRNRLHIDDLVENTVAFPTVDGFEFEMDTFTWTSEDETLWSAI